MDQEREIHIIVEIAKTEERKLVFHQDHVTGREIKEKAGVPLERELAAERDGKLHPIANDEKITIRDGEHFVVVVKAVKIFVNGREETVTTHKITYEEVVAFAYPNPNFQDYTYKVTYFHKDGKHEGTLTKGESVEVKEGMVFTVVRAVRS
jgi:hypothetical protein